MGDSSLDPETIKKTQETLGKFVKKPPLSEKLLKKPPFKFLYDIFSVVSSNIIFLYKIQILFNRLHYKYKKRKKGIKQIILTSCFGNVLIFFIFFNYYVALVIFAWEILILFFFSFYYFLSDSFINFPIRKSESDFSKYFIEILN